MTDDPRRILATLLAIAAGWLGALGAEEVPVKPPDHTAPVEDPGGKKGATPGPRGGASTEPDWTLLPAWARGSNLSQTGHLVNPAGTLLGVKGRVMGLALANAGRHLLVKTDSRLVVVDADAFQVLGEYEYPDRKDGGSMHGLAVGPDGVSVYVTGQKASLYTATIDGKGALAFGPAIDLSIGKKATDPLGVAVAPDGRTAVVALALANQVAVVDLAMAKPPVFVPVGVCPYGVVISADGRTAFVSDFGGPHPAKGDKTARSAGTDVAVDERSVALRGAVSVIDLAAGTVAGEIATRIQPEAMALSADGGLLYVVDASGDGITVIDIARRKAVGALDTKPRADLPYGSLTNGLALSSDGKTLFAANAGNNAIALLDPARRAAPPYGLIPAGGFPGAVCVRGHDLFVANVFAYRGDVQKLSIPERGAALDRMTAEAQRGFHLAEILRAQARAQSGARPRPVPAEPGQPSPIRHVVYVIKENKKFDQVLGDLGKGNCEPKLCEFPRATTPNTHALAEQFVVLDNYYCNGVLSCDGHQWAVQGLTSPYREKDWSGARCAYDFGRDALCFAGCGFIWDHVLRHGVSFRNFGEFDVPTAAHGRSWSDFYATWKTGTGTATFTCDYQVETLRRYSDLRYPGWELAIPDQVRADAFLAALGEFSKAGKMPEFVTIYLPNDHTQGARKGCPTPRAYVADNDLALGRIVAGLSQSPFWKDMAVFVNEDDPQTGTDHVDGHRSFCLVAGPYVKRGGAVISRFYNQSSVLHTISRIFGVPPMNQLVAMAPVMDECFQDEPDPTPYICCPATVPLDELNPDPKQAPSKAQARLAPKLEHLDFSRPDLIDRDAELFSRVVWATVHGDERFPAEFAGAHGKGLKALGLRLAPEADDDD